MKNFLNFAAAVFAFVHVAVSAAHADDLPARVAQLENRVTMLEKINSPACQSGIDGVVHADSYIYRRRTNGEFENSQHWLNSMFDVKVIKKFQASGKDLVLVRNRKCQYFYYLASDVQPING